MFLPRRTEKDRRPAADGGTVDVCELVFGEEDGGARRRFGDDCKVAICNECWSQQETGQALGLVVVTVGEKTVGGDRSAALPRNRAVEEEVLFVNRGKPESGKLHLK